MNDLVIEHVDDDGLRLLCEYSYYLSIVLSGLTEMHDVLLTADAGYFPIMNIIMTCK